MFSKEEIFAGVVLLVITIFSVLFASVINYINYYKKKQEDLRWKQCESRCKRDSRLLKYTLESAQWQIVLLTIGYKGE